jgi:hypothetical protein
MIVMMVKEGEGSVSRFPFEVLLYNKVLRKRRKADILKPNIFALLSVFYSALH